MREEKDSIEDPKQRLAACFSMWRRAKGRKDEPPKAKAEHVLSVFNVAQDIDIRRETIDGKEHIVLPMWRSKGRCLPVCQLPEAELLRP